MKNFKLYILRFLYLLFATVEFIWSVAVAIIEAVGSKLNELVDVIEQETKKAKS